MSKHKTKPPVKWGYTHGQPVVLVARGAIGRTLPLARWRDLQDAVAGLREAASAIHALRSTAPEVEARALPVVAAHAVSLIDLVDQNMRAIVALSPRLRADLDAVRGGAA